MCFYWLWTNMTFQMPAVLRPVGAFGLVLPFQVCILVGNVVTYLVAVGLFWLRGVEPRGRVALWLMCIAMTAGCALVAVWQAGESPAGLVVYGVGSLAAGAGSALLCVEMQRVYGSFESDVILFHGAGSYLVSVAVALLVGLLPSVVSLVVWAVSPLPVARCLLVERRSLTKRELYGRGGGTELKLPWKLLITSLLHGLSLGLLAGFPVFLEAGPAVVACVGASYLLSSVLIVLTAFAAKMNFNSLIYQMAFPLIALGLLLLEVLGAVPLVGVSVQLVGFSYLHLVMWCVCSFLIKGFDRPTMWVTGTSTCLFMAGQLSGMMLSCASVQLDVGSAYSKVLTVAIFVMLGSSLLMISNANMRTGWGLYRPDSRRVHATTPLDIAIAQMASHCGLTVREEATLRLLGRGYNRGSIADEHGVSRETVKTHIAGIYRKVHVHSHQELIAALEARAAQVEKDETT